MPLPPIDNYTFLPALPDPAAQARSNLDLATGLVGAQQKSQAFDLQVQDAERQRQQQQVLQQNLATVAQNPTPDAIARLMVLHPELADKFKPTYEALDKKEQAARVSQASQIYAAFASGAPDVALKKIDELATAKENSGQSQDAQQLRAIGELGKTNPKAARMSLGAFLASALGPEKFAETFKGLTLLPGEQRLGEANATTAEAKAAHAEENEAGIAAKSTADATTAGEAAGVAAEKEKLGLAQARATTASLQAATDKVRDELGRLPPEELKTYGEQYKTLQSARTASANAADLATQFEAASKNGEMPAGAAGVLSEKWKAFWGDEDKVTRLRQQYATVANASILDQLKGAGRITEREIELIKAGVPSQTAKPEIIAESLRAIQKVHDVQAGMSGDMLKWITANRSAGPATKAFVFNGRKIQKGDQPPGVLEPVSPAAAPKTDASAPGAPAPAPAAPGKTHVAHLSSADLAAEKAALLARAR